MRGLKKFAAIAGALALMALPGGAVADDPQLELMQPGELVIGYYPTAGGFDVKDGRVEGIFGLVIEKVAERLGLTPVYKAFDFPALIPAVQAGRVDMAGPFSITQPRAQVLYLTTPMFLQPEAMAVRPDTDLTSWEEAAAKGMTLASNVGYFQIGAWEELGINVHTFDNIDACFMDVVNRGADGCAVGAFDLIYRQATQPNSPVAQLKVVPMSGPRITADLNSYGVSKNSPRLAAAISQAITDLWRDGSIEAAYHETFKDAQYDLFLNAPQGHALYLPGPWEEGVVPPAPAGSAPQTVAAGKLTIGVPSSSTMLSSNGEGPEGDIIRAVAAGLGLEPAFVAVDDAASALDSGSVDVIAGQLAETEASAHQMWFTEPVAFDPDYIYVRPGDGGAYPGYASWEDAVADGGHLVVVTGDPRIADLQAAGVAFEEAPDAKAALSMVAQGEATGFVGSTVDFASAVSSDPALVDAGLGWVRNKDTHTLGYVYAWGVKVGNVELANALDREIVRSWQTQVMAQAFRSAFPQTNVTALLAPGPTAIGTSFGASKDYRMESTFLAGPWTQRPGWSQ
ncbi:MAG: transporter substrate-binding domain-containing protein [Hyphomicrobiaceae bacterium]|nr:transporter substrate-binding domain-containing protein [Hyphomicrobiaceae bacterium]